MKRIFILAAVLLAFSGLYRAEAQSQMPGTVIYSLPQTTISVTVKVKVEKFTPGPYAQFAKKYFGTDARKSAGSSCTVESVSLCPYIEADPTARYSVAIPAGSAASFFQVCSQGLVALSDGYAGKPSSARFQSQAGADQFVGIAPANLSNVTTTLYKTVQNENGEFEKVPVQQSQLIETSPEKKAEDAASAIFNLRDKRIQIITGDTDATFSGEALEAAIKEIARLESEYMSLFFGKTDTFIQEQSFDVVPANGKKVATICRISDDQGLLPASASQGRSINMEIVPETLATPAAFSGKGRDNVTINYRVPAVSACKIVDGGKVLIESRIPVYQLGEKVTMTL